MAEGQDLDLGTAGASGRREYERRRAKREDAVRKRHPRIGNVLLKFQQAPGHEKAWATGAQGEEELATCLANRCPEVIVLHDRRLPRSRANIDHLAIAPSGVHVIDAKRYKGKIEVCKPFFGEPRLVIGGRDKTKLVDGLERQIEAVKSALRPIAPDVPVEGCFCFINPADQAGGSGVPLMRTLSIREHRLFYPRRLAKQLSQPGELAAERIRPLAVELARQFPPA
jgi:Nuclease-related domain